MNTVTNVVDGVYDSIQDIFTGGALSSTTKKVLVAVAIGFVVLILIFLAYYYLSSPFGSRRVAGMAGCCTKSQGPRLMQVEAALSQQDMDESNRLYDLSGEPKMSQFVSAQGFDNVQGFSSPSAKPTATAESATADGWNGSGPMVRQQVPSLPFVRPTINESDFINMAYSA